MNVNPRRGLVEGADMILMAATSKTRPRRVATRIRLAGRLIRAMRSGFGPARSGHVDCLPRLPLPIEDAHLQHALKMLSAVVSDA